MLRNCFDVFPIPIIKTLGKARTKLPHKIDRPRILACMRKLRIVIKAFLLTGSIIYAITGCIPTKSEFTPSSSENMMITSPTVQTPIFIASTGSPPTLTLTSTIPPTLTAGERQIAVSELLTTNSGCLLPCWWGITPGKTSWVEARHFLDSFMIYIAEQGSSELFYESVEVPLPAPYSNATYMAHTYLVKSGVVDSIEIYNFNLAPNYYFPKFLETYGQPAEVWIRTFSQEEMGIQPFLIDLFYPGKGILVEYSTGYPMKDVGGKLQNCLKGLDSPFIFLWSPEKQYLSF